MSKRGSGSGQRTHGAGGSRDTRDTPLDGGRLTKAQRKEAARLQRLELQRKVGRQRRNRRIIVGVAVAAALAAAVYAIVRPRPDVLTPRELLAAAPAAANAAGCEDVETVGTFDPESNDRAHISSGGVGDMPAVSRYPSVPPASGPHNPIPLPAGVYDSPPALDQAIHSLEHGAVIIWYDPSTPEARLDEIRQFFDDADQRDHVIIAPYDYPEEGSSGTLPGGDQVALVAWHHVQHCARASLPMAFDFVAHYRFPAFDGEDYLGDAPEPGSAI